MDPDEFAKLLQTILNDTAKKDMVEKFYMETLYDILNEYEDEKGSSYISSIFESFRKQCVAAVPPATDVSKVIVL